MSTPRDWSFLIGKACSFTGPDGKARLVGVIKAAVDAGLTARGAIPDATVTVQGASGKTVEISLVEHYLQLTNA